MSLHKRQRFLLLSMRLSIHPQEIGPTGAGNTSAEKTVTSDKSRSHDARGAGDCKSESETGKAGSGLQVTTRASPCVAPTLLFTSATPAIRLTPTGPRPGRPGAYIQDDVCATPDAKFAGTAQSFTCHV